MTNIQEVLDAALGLVVADRAVLAERLLASLEDLDEREADQLWAEESQRRLDAFRGGTARARLADEVHAQAERMLGD